MIDDVRRRAVPCPRRRYRFDWPRAIFFTLRFRDPRTAVRLALGAAFFVRYV